MGDTRSFAVSAVRGGRVPYRPLLLSAIALAAAVPAVARASHPQTVAPQTQYSLAGGCYSLRSQSAGGLVAKTADGHYRAVGGAATGESFRMQATALGRYVLYGPGADFLTTDAANKVVSSTTPDDWRVDPVGGGAFTISSPATSQKLAVAPGSGDIVVGGTGAAAQFTFVSASGCAQFPDVELNATGQPARGASPEGEVSGFIDAHMHWGAFEFIGGDFHCGHPWNPFGVAYALPDCAGTEGPDGSASPVQNFLNYGEPNHPHDTKGWPDFKDWPRYHQQTYEQTYYRWVQRAWMAGERLIVVPLVANKALCDAFQPKHNACDEMDTARLELRDMRLLQDYIDAQSGGPGKGWMQIVTDPFQARAVMNSGKLAVVIGIETSELFGCSGSAEAPHCDRAKIDRGLDEFQHGGVSSIFLVNKFDNALAGVRFDGGPVGAIINAVGNKSSSGSFWSAKTCTGPEHDNTIYGGSAADAAIASLGLSSQVPGGVPVYPPPPHCNTRGLTALGEHLINRLMQRHMILEIDHLSALAGDQALSLLEPKHYSGVISAHSWIDPLTYPRIYNLGGIVTPHAGSSLGFVSNWRDAKKSANSRYYFGFGYGSDINGLSAQGPPRAGNAANPVSYPFKSFDGRVTFDRQRSGTHVFDINSDGVAHYGLYPDWMEDLRKIAGDQILTDMFRGGEAYLQMWERASGVPAESCRSPRTRFTRRGLGGVRLRTAPEPLLRSAGQPHRRIGRVFYYCVGGARNSRANVSAVFTPRVTVGLVASTARAPRKRAIGAGTRASRLRGITRAFGHGVRVGRLGRRGRVFYGVRRGRVRWVAVATEAVGRTPRRLRSYLRLARLR